ncbi:MAG: Flp pilus assembly complex ATPase component TadA [Alphaproteobacteria bacterium]|nr:Flp pilus assembly complex ATPase component TadA [Alphaproteobacteria bacterium]
MSKNFTTDEEEQTAEAIPLEGFEDNESSLTGNVDIGGSYNKDFFTAAAGGEKLANVEDFLDELFANNNQCITALNGMMPINDEETRRMLALFTNGRFIVSRDHRYSGQVLTFSITTRRRNISIKQPELVPSTWVQKIYERAMSGRVAGGAQISEEEETQMMFQRAFVDVISRAAAKRSSDIHMVIGEKTTFMFRVNGIMQVEAEYNKEWGESFARSAFASADISDSNYATNEYQSAQKSGRTPLRGSKGRLMLPAGVLAIRLQFNPIAFGTRYLVMRLLYSTDSSASSNGLESLGYTPRELDMFFRLRAAPMGLIVISGPTGSGKSTTLQQNMIQMLQEKRYETNLITVEDPPEYPIPGARQMPVTNAANEEMKVVEFTKALAACLRSDPDTMMIGEIRTLSAATLAFQGALSGHGVWTTLHANSSPAIITRLRDKGVETFKLGDPDLMKGMVSQRLCRKLCPACKVPASQKPKDPAVKRLYKSYGDYGVSQVFIRGEGCKECQGRGSIGRVAICEILMPNGTFLEMIVKNETRKAIDYWISDLSGRTLKDSAVERMFMGLIEIEEVERWCGLMDAPPVY